MKQPNFLFITTDQQRADHLGCYGNPIVKTPTIDSLAARGTLFEQFYATCPICMPNRIAILTGRMPTVNSTRLNGIPLSKDAVTFVDILRAGGYHTGLVGKSHLQNITQREANLPASATNRTGSLPPDDLNEAHRARRSGPEYDSERMPLWHKNPERDEPPLPYYGFDHVRFANGHSDHVQGHYTGWLNSHSDNSDGLRGPENALSSPTDIVAPQAWRTAIPEELYPTAYIADESCHFIDQHLSDKPDSPFFLHCSFTDPHHPFTPPGKYFDMYQPDDIPLPESFFDRDPEEPPLLTRLREEFKNGKASNEGPIPFCASEEQTRQIIALTYGMITCIDDAIARLLAHLEAKGVLDNTVVIFSSDHGDFMGDHGIMLKHGLHYNGVIRVPFIVADPQRPEPVRTQLHGTSIDTGAVILARAGLAPYNGFQGVDITAVQNGELNTPRRGILIEEDALADHLEQKDGVRVRSYIEDNWRITLWDGVEQGELFDLNTDPQEINNLWSKAEYSEKRAQLTEAMLREMMRLNDTSPIASHVA